MRTFVAAALMGLAAALAAGPGPSLLSTRLGHRHDQWPSRSGHTRTPPAHRIVPGWSRRVLSALRAARTRWRRTARETDKAGAVTEACVMMAAELSAGRPPPLALRTVATEWPDVFAVPAGRATVGGSVTPSLRTAAREPGAESLAAVAAAWEVSDRTGAKLADTLLAVADSLRNEAGIKREADAQLATVRVTARLMAVLPIATLGVFSAGSGGEPVRFLLTTPYGIGCLAGAGALVSLGLLWVERTARRATRSAWSA